MDNGLGPCLSERIHEWRMSQVYHQRQHVVTLRAGLDQGWLPLLASPPSPSTLMADDMSVAPLHAQSLAVVVAPNTKPLGEGEIAEVVDTADGAVEANLKSAKNKPAIRRGDIAFQAAISNSNERRVSKVWLCMRDAVAREGKLMCKFAKSQLWN